MRRLLCTLAIIIGVLAVLPYEAFAQQKTDT